MITFGRHTYEDGLIVHSYAGAGEADHDIRVGAYCSLAADVQLLPGGMHDTKGVSTFPWFRIMPGSGAPMLRGPIVIGNDVWVGRGARILGGVTVGDGAIIGAWSTVAKDVPAYHVAVGNPARFHPRPHAVHAKALQRIAWWDWPDGDPRLVDVRDMPVAEFVQVYG